MRLPDTIRGREWQLLMAQVRETRHYTAFLLYDAQNAGWQTHRITIDTQRRPLNAELFSVMYPGAYDAADQASPVSTCIMNHAPMPHL